MNEDIMEIKPADTHADNTQGELFSFLLRLEPKEAGQVFLGAGQHIQAAFLDLMRQVDPVLTDALHQPNQRRPYTLSHLKGFHHLTEAERESSIIHQQPIAVAPGQSYWLRITALDTRVFTTFLLRLPMLSQNLVLRIGTTPFLISRVLAADQDHQHNSWSAYTTFAQLLQDRAPQKHYHLEFASPTAFSKGQQSWGKQLMLFPTAAEVFASLANQWEFFAPDALRLSHEDMQPSTLASWCEEAMIVTHYELKTRYLPSRKFGQTGFLGHVTYEVKGAFSDPQARWLTPLARFALFCGVGYKTAMGMGQCRSLLHDLTGQPAEQTKRKVEDGTIASPSAG